MPREPSIKIQIQNHDFLLELVSAPEDIARGLGGRDSIGKYGGMYFDLPDNSSPTFWMKDMKFPIDLIWIRGQRVLGIEEHMPPDDGVVLYPAPFPVDAVLELPAGTAREINLRIGDAVKALQ